MTARVRVFLNERPVEISDTLSVLDVVAAADPTVVDALRDGTAYVTDGVGRPIDPGVRVFPGAILRVVRSARGGPRA